MNLKILLPAEILIDNEVTKIVAEAENGYFCLLPHHVDFVASLIPGIFSYEAFGGRDNYLAIDGGTLVKRGQEVLVSIRNAVKGPELGTLKQVVDEQFEELDEKEKKARTAATRLEVDLLRRFLELREHA
ncbi:MAG: F0F1 ATP synthase subunit epsilon [Deltaproteobacteria bacterium]|jgi:F-type H+-transporting ATPase subunit epsilon|nr:F0F1 ATP synthase subunit epsilon [Deltaproteobacteria bacterium]